MKPGGNFNSSALMTSVGFKFSHRMHWAEAEGRRMQLAQKQAEHEKEENE